MRGCHGAGRQASGGQQQAALRHMRLAWARQAATCCTGHCAPASTRRAPIFSRGKSLLPPMRSMMLRSPLWPPWPPRCFRRTAAVGESRSSETTRTRVSGTCGRTGRTRQHGAHSSGIAALAPGAAPSPCNISPAPPRCRRCCSALWCVAWQRGVWRCERSEVRSHTGRPQTTVSPQTLRPPPTHALTTAPPQPTMNVMGFASSTLRPASSPRPTAALFSSLRMSMPSERAMASTTMNPTLGHGKDRGTAALWHARKRAACRAGGGRCSTRSVVHAGCTRPGATAPNMRAFVTHIVPRALITGARVSWDAGAGMQAEGCTTHCEWSGSSGNVWRSDQLQMRSDNRAH